MEYYRTDNFYKNHIQATERKIAGSWPSFRDVYKSKRT